MKPNTRISLVMIMITIIILIKTESSSQTLPPFSCKQPSSSTTFPFCNVTLPISERANDVVSRLTLDEKVMQLVNGATGVERLGVSEYEWWSEALHGVSRHGKGVRFNGTITASTMFPQVVLTAATFDESVCLYVEL
uniref:Probable beta-D-xylosidase 7 n=1 Tax=Tanacetum cinerariifolium TaxID=118510 RepID=A0A699QC63_TANCI|nr:probable beta-D-xylosidase 7 [Tanacetum cinerariifolium]